MGPIDKIRALIRSGHVHMPYHGSILGKDAEPPVLLGWKVPGKPFWGSAQASGAQPSPEYVPPKLDFSDIVKERPEGITYADQVQRWIFDLRKDLQRQVEEAGIEPDWDTLQISADLGRTGDDYAIVASVEEKKRPGDWGIGKYGEEDK